VEHGFETLADGTARLKCSGAHEAGTYNEGLHVTVDRVRGLDVPTTIAIGGRVTEPNPASLAREIIDALPRAKLVEYDHLGHFGPLQDPDGLVRDIVAVG
jgi:pimeloyl-ACP methyl ester carboxylesterase